LTSPFLRSTLQKVAILNGFHLYPINYYFIQTFKGGDYQTMLQLLFYMNLMGIIFYLLHLLSLPFEKKFMPPNYRVLIYRLNLAFFIIPLPVCLYFVRRCFDNFVLKIPISPFYYNGTHIIIHIGQNINFILPSLNYFQIFLIITWMGVMIIKYLQFTTKNREFRKLNSSLSLLQKEELPKSSINITNLVNIALKELHIKKKPRILLQENLLVPHVSGIFRTTLCLPCHWDVSEQVYYMAIKHELAHVRHKDLLFQRISLIAQIISWFNPILYLLCSKMEACEELAADACACNGASRLDCNAYQTTILNLSVITSSKTQQTSIKSLGFKRKRKNFTVERILTMKNKNLHKHKPLKLATTIFISVVIFSLSTVPALAYTLPSAIKNLNIDPIDIIHVNLLPTDDNSFSELTSIQPIEDDLNSLFKIIDFTESNFACIDENGIVSNDVVIPQIISCNHNYCLTARTSQHDKDLTGSCTIMYHNAKKCSKCNHIIIQDLIATMSYDQCPHNSDSSKND